MPFDQMPLLQMPFWKMPFWKMPFWKMPFDQMPFSIRLFDQIAFWKIPFWKMPFVVRLFSPSIACESVDVSGSVGDEHAATPATITTIASCFVFTTNLHVDRRVAYLTKGVAVNQNPQRLRNYFGHVATSGCR